VKRRWKSNLGLLVHHPFLFARFYRWPLLVLLVGSLADVVTSWEVLSRFGPEVELHPIGRLAGRLLGVSLPVIAAGKLIQLIAAIFVASLVRRWCGWLLTQLPQLGRFEIFLSAQRAAKRRLRGLRDPIWSFRAC